LTALSSVFRRIASETQAPAAEPVLSPPAPPRRFVPVPPPRPVSRPLPARAPVSTPQLLGFAEPVAHIPPVEDFLPLREEPAPTVAAPVETAIREPEPEPPPAEPQPPPQEPAPPPPAQIQARVRDLPPRTAAHPPPILAERPGNLVGRLGRRLGDMYSPPLDEGARFVTLPPAPAPQARRAPEPPPPETRATPTAVPAESPPAARRAPEPAQKLVTPGPLPVAERGSERGRPSLPRNRRLYRRARLPAEIEIDGVPCTLIDVSIGGFAATGGPPLEPNALVPVMLRLTIDGIDVGTLLKARIIYVTQGRSAGRFVELSPSQMAFLRYVVTWRGESIGAVGTTTLLDAISSRAERGFSPEPAAGSDAEMKSRWWAGLIGRGVKPPR
jgi:hypothetical protein